MRRNLLILIALALLCVVGWGLHGRISQRTAWEYKVVIINGGVEAKLNELGEQNWELVSFQEYPSSALGVGNYIFKRPK